MEHRQKVSEAMTPSPRMLSQHANVEAAARLMREENVGAIVICDDAEAVCGMVTDRDIVLRVIAEGRSPVDTRLKDICTPDPACLPPSAEITEAVQLIREKAIRRVPIVDDGRLVGIVSLGDLAAIRDPDSALGQISAAPPQA